MALQHLQKININETKGMQEIGQVLRGVRTIHNVGTALISERAGILEGTYLEIERGNVPMSLNMARSVFDALGLVWAFPEGQDNTMTLRWRNVDYLISFEEPRLVLGPLIENEEGIDSHTGAPVWTEYQKFWITDVVRDLLTDTEVGAYAEGVTDLFTCIFRMEDGGHSDVMAYAFGAVPAVQAEVTTESVNDIEVKDCCVVIRQRSESRLIKEILGPITQGNARNLVEDYQDHSTLTATLFELS